MIDHVIAVAESVRRGDLTAVAVAEAAVVLVVAVLAVLAEVIVNSHT